MAEDVVQGVPRVNRISSSGKAALTLSLQRSIIIQSKFSILIEAILYSQVGHLDQSLTELMEQFTVTAQ